MGGGGPGDGRDHARGGGKHRGGGKERRDYGEGGRVGAGGDGSGGHGAGPNGVDASVRYRSVEEVVGSLLSAARDQNVCRFLQKKFDEGGPEAIELVFPELLENVAQLMMDPFGNYLVQKVLDRCSEEQRLKLMEGVVVNANLVNIALDIHGTRAVQKLVETVKTPDQSSVVIKALEPGVVSLIKDLNGNHVVQRCLQHLGAQECQFIYDAARQHCIDIATHRHGCCVLQRCVDYASEQQRGHLVMRIAQNALVLSQDPFGNYVVQYILDLGDPAAVASVMQQLRGHYSELSTQKFSSNVVEKCLKVKDPHVQEEQEFLVAEVMHSPDLARLLQDPYANYVVQSALGVSSGDLHMQLVDQIRPHLGSLRGTPHGKRILAKLKPRPGPPSGPTSGAPAVDPPPSLPGGGEAPAAPSSPRGAATPPASPPPPQSPVAAEVQ